MNDKNLKKKIEVPLTTGFDTNNPIGVATLCLTEAEIEMLANGIMSFAPAFIVNKSSDIATGVYTDVELLEISLVPTANYINYLKQNGLYNDNNDNTDRLKR